MDRFNDQTFPKTEAEFLAMRYIQSMDISGLSPTELADRYLEIIGTINQRLEQKIQPHYKEV